MALLKRYDMSMALQASIFTSDAKVNSFDHNPTHPHLFEDILKQVASTIETLLDSLLLHEKKDDEQVDERPKALQ